MDRARPESPWRIEYRRGYLKSLLTLAVVVTACSSITGDLDRIIAIAVEGPLQRSVEENDSLLLVARAIDAKGDTVLDVEITWELLDADSDGTSLGFTLDAQLGLIRATSPGKGRVRPKVQSFTPAEYITVSVTAAPDSVMAAGDLTIVMTSAEVTSSKLEVVVYDLTTVPATAAPLPDKPVQFAVVAPDPNTAEAAGFFLVLSPQDSVPEETPHTVVATTDAMGLARAFVRKTAGASLPDSVVVHTNVSTAIGETARGSPVRFVVVFDEN